jgi:hypothetical protein
MRESFGREPPWNADRRARFADGLRRLHKLVCGARAAPKGKAVEEQRLSAFRFLFIFGFFFRAVPDRDLSGPPWPG